MKPRSVMLSGAVAGCLIGFLAVRGAGPRLREMLADEAAAGRDRQPGGIHGDRASIRSERPGGNRASVKGRSFAELLKEVPAIAARNNPCKDVERMDVGQLKSLIRDCLPQPGSVPLADREVATMVRSAAARELYRREGVESLEWAAAEIPAEHRPAVLSELLMVTAEDSPDLMKTWADRYRGEYGDEWAKRFNLSAVQGAAGRGAYELLRVRELLSTQALPKPSSYPEGFDFQFLVTRSSPTWSLYETVTYWSGIDREASWNTVKGMMEARGGNGTGFIGCVFQGVLAMDGEEKAAEWIVGKLAEIPAEHRQRAIQSLNSSSLTGPEVSVALVRALPDPAERVSYASQQFSPRRSSTLEVLRALDSPQLQTEALVAVATKHARFAGPGPAGDATRALFTSTIDRLQLDTHSREKIMETLDGSPPR